MIKKCSLLVCAVLTSHAALADSNSNVQSVIDAFTNCDNSFFYQLKSNQSDFNGITDLVVKDDIAYIPVEDVTQNDRNITFFEQPIEYRGLTITGYQNIYIETPFLGQYYYWGMVIDGSVDNVKASLNQLPWQQYNSSSYVASPKLFDRQVKNSGWQNNPYAIDGVIPRAFTVEKSLYLEPINEHQVHLVCSIQGDVNKDILYSIHPDMRYIDEHIDAVRQQKINAIKEQLQNQKHHDDATVNPPISAQNQSADKEI